MKQIISILLVLSCHSAINACDVCGSSTGGQGLGLLPQANLHFAGIQYQYKSFNSIHPALSDTQPDTRSSEHYRTLQAWGRLYLNKRWQLFAFVPYKINSYSSSNGDTAINGIGDVSVLASYTFINTADDNVFMHRLQGGIGIKAPTGVYSGISERVRQGTPNIEPGSGSWDVPLNINYTAKHNNAGINVDAMYNITSPGADRYKFGNRLSTQLTGFYWLQLGKVSILPQATIQYDQALHDYEDYDKKWLNTQTGGHIIVAKPGAQVYYKNLGLQVAYSIPLWQEFGGGYVRMQKGLDAGLMFLF